MVEELPGPEVVISDNRFFVYGEGSDRKSALADYLSSLFEFYELSAAASERGAPADREFFAFVSRYLQPIAIQEALSVWPDAAGPKQGA